MIFTPVISSNKLLGGYPAQQVWWAGGRAGDLEISARSVRPGAFVAAILSQCGQRGCELQLVAALGRLIINQRVLRAAPRSAALGGCDPLAIARAVHLALANVRSEIWQIQAHRAAAKAASPLECSKGWFRKIAKPKKSQLGSGVRGGDARLLTRLNQARAWSGSVGWFLRHSQPRTVPNGAM